MSIRRALAAAERHWAADPDVSGIAEGLDGNSIQLLLARPWKPDSLPAFVPARGADGRRVEVRLQSSVVGPVLAACSAGSPLTKTGERGVITLLFRNQLGVPSSEFLAITCAHVVGDMWRVRPVSPWVWSSCCPAIVPMGETKAGSVRVGASVEYDIAIVKLNRNASFSCQLGDRRTRRGVELRSFVPTRSIHVGMRVECEFPVSRVAAATVAKPAATVFMELWGQRLAVRNAFTLSAKVLPGDSGGLLHQGGRAVGILFGRSPEGWGWFHALGDAVAHLAGIRGVPEFRVFH